MTHDINSIINFAASTPQEKAILMCIERIERLEDRVQDLTEECRQSYIRDILTCTTKDYIAIDVFAFLLGISHEKRNTIPTDEFMFDYLRKHSPSPVSPRIEFLYSKLRDTKRPWTLTYEDKVNPPYGWFDTDYGSNVYEMLNAMTYDEIKAYWTYRLKWTKCVGWDKAP
jgi:hypothetical protein